MDKCSGSTKRKKESYLWPDFLEIGGVLSFAQALCLVLPFSHSSSSGELWWLQCCILSLLHSVNSKPACPQQRVCLQSTVLWVLLDLTEPQPPARDRHILQGRTYWPPFQWTDLFLTPLLTLSLRMPKYSLTPSMHSPESDSVNQLAEEITDKGQRLFSWVGKWPK